MLRRRSESENQLLKMKFRCDHAANALLLQSLEAMPEVLAVQEQWEAVLKEARKKHKPIEPNL